MLSTLWARQVCAATRSGASGLSWRRRVAYSTAVNVKPQRVEHNAVDTFQSEWAQAKPFEAVPGPSKWQMLRSFMTGGDFANASLNEIMEKGRQNYGDIFALPGLFGNPDAVVTFNLDDMEKVYRTEGIYPSRPGGDAMVYYRKSRKDGFFDDIIGLAARGEDWAKVRHAANPIIMHPKHAKLYLDPMQKVNQQFIQRIRQIRDPHTLEVPDNFLDTINRLTFETICIVALDKELNLLKAEKMSSETAVFFDNIQVFLQSILELGIKPSIYKYIETPAYKRFAKAMDIIFDLTYKYTHEAIARIEQERQQLGAARVEKSVLEKLLQVDKKIAIIMAMDMLTAGVDTSSTVITGILLAIAKNPTKQQKLREELLNVLPHKDMPFSIENMKHLPYLRACIKEALRVYPVAASNLRETGADLVLSGYRIPKGTTAFLSSNMLLCEEKYFPRATEFIPERWLRGGDKSSGDEKLVADNLSPFIYLPFGFGPRSCIGKRIVDMELEMTVANLVRNFNIEFNYSAEQPFKHHFINTPAIPLKFKFTDLNY